MDYVAQRGPNPLVEAMHVRQVVLLEVGLLRFIYFQSYHFERHHELHLGLQHGAGAEHS